MAAFNADSSRQLDSGADFKLQSADQGHKGHTLNTASERAGGAKKAAASAAAGGFMWVCLCFGGEGGG